jgi:succinate dehydrogenase (ubiquinone) iron-sulfur subunit
MLSQMLRRGASMRLLPQTRTSFNNLIQPRVFSSMAPRDINPGYKDLPDVTKIDYTVEFDQGLTDEQKSSMKRFDIYRANPSDPEDKPKYVTYYVDLNKCGPMILDALIKIKDEIDPTLSFRRSCREGICGSCSMNIDGRHHLACLSAIPKENMEKSVVSPLMYMFVLKDLVVDMSHFYAQYKAIEPFLKVKTPKVDPNQEYLQTIEDRKLLDGLYECVLCACCQSTCPSYWWHPQDYLGPAVLMQAYRWVIDSRDEYTEERLEMLGGDMKLGECYQIGLCSLTCPKGLNPRAALGHLKELYAEYDKKRTEETVTI